MCVCVWESCNGWTSCLTHWRWAWLNAVGGVEEQRKQPRRWMQKGATEPCWYFIIWIMNRAATWLSAWWRSYRRVGGLSSHHKSQIHSCFQLARLCFSFRSIHWTLLASKATRNHVTPDKASFCANSNSVLIWACISKCFSSWTINNQFLPSFFLSVLSLSPLIPCSLFFLPIISFPLFFCSFFVFSSFLHCFYLSLLPSYFFHSSFFLPLFPSFFPIIILCYFPLLFFSLLLLAATLICFFPSFFFNFVFTSKCYCFSFLPAPPNY